MTSRRIAFMGTPGFAVPALETLHQAGQQILAVYCQPPKPTGRGMQLTPTPVHQAAEKLGLIVRTPEKLNADEVAYLTSLNLDLICVAAYGLLLPTSVLKVAPCVNLHPSALPRWRGAAPLNHTLLKGDTTTDRQALHQHAPALASHLWTTNDVIQWYKYLFTLSRAILEWHVQWEVTATNFYARC
jgi:methionyl-tRNA formyltransferase